MRQSGRARDPPCVVGLLQFDAPRAETRFERPLPEHLEQETQSGGQRGPVPFFDHVPRRDGRRERDREIAALLVKHGRGDLIRSAGLESALPDTDLDHGDPEAAAGLANDLEAMGPTYVKLGQLLSTRVDLISPAYVEALSRLQDDVAPFPFEEVERLYDAAIAAAERGGASIVPIKESGLGGGKLGGLLQFRNDELGAARNGLGRIAIGLAGSFNDQHRLGQGRRPVGERLGLRRRNGPDRDVRDHHALVRLPARTGRQLRDRGRWQVFRDGPEVHELRSERRYRRLLLISPSSRAPRVARELANAGSL